MAHIVKESSCAVRTVTIPRAYPLELADNLDGIAPAGTPIMSACFIVEKIDVAVSNGKNEWYAIAADRSVKCISAGQPWSDLYN